jgi:transcriptional regulator with XRE-family HTH domain
MEKSTFTPLYERFRARLVAMRKKANMTQRELARRLGREHSFVSRIELGERRLDVVEFYWLCRACGFDPPKAAADLMREFARTEEHGGSNLARDSRGKRT